MRHFRIPLFMATRQLIGTLLAVTLIGSATAGSDVAKDSFDKMLQECSITAQMEQTLARPQGDASTAQADIGFVSSHEEGTLLLTKQQQGAESVRLCQWDSSIDLLAERPVPLDADQAPTQKQQRATDPRPFTAEDGKSIHWGVLSTWADN
jgi:hypothetical protein